MLSSVKSCKMNLLNPLSNLPPHAPANISGFDLNGKTSVDFCVSFKSKLLLFQDSTTLPYNFVMRSI